MTQPFFNNFFPENIFTFISDHRFDFTLTENQNDLTRGQKKWLLENTQIKFNRLINIRQVHGTKIIVADKSYSPLKNKIEVADGIVTDIPNLAIAVRTADCVPVFIVDPVHHCIGIVHAGWRGTQKQILMETLKLMNKQWKTKPGDALIGFGPCIKSCCYKVGQEFGRFFPAEVIKKKDGFYFDLGTANKNQLLEFGVRERNILESSVCTSCDSNYFSYRRQKDDAGRMISLAMIL